MRVNPDMVSSVLAGLQQSQSTLNTALQEVSTGKRVTVPSDDPAASADMVQNTIDTKDVDQYTQNASSVLSTVQTADSTLSSVVSDLTKAISLGTEGPTAQRMRPINSRSQLKCRGLSPVLFRRQTPRIKGRTCSAVRRVRRLRIPPIRLQLPGTNTTETAE